MNQTLKYYDENAEKFAADTLAVDFTSTQERFLSKLPSGAVILDFGCGSGRDTIYFLDRGYRVTAVDGSPELCKLASAYTGIPIRQMLFRELADTETYDGIWACASILHVPSAELPDIFRRMITALKPGGAMYVSFKYGIFEGERNDRWFTDFTEEAFAAFLMQFPKLTIEDQWISADVRPGRFNERWLNVILGKKLVQ
ncbi:MAG: class I SAM-dependent methyltransferase [Anaerolineaceae bacterium]|nr:class I SAM-dependent methyltransferase [Anaerolineaceae bacterium]